MITKISPQAKLITQQYKDAKISRNMYLKSLGFTMSIGGLSAYNHLPLFTFVYGLLAMATVKPLEKSINKMLELKPEYKEIVKRAKQIKRCRKA